MANLIKIDYWNKTSTFNKTLPFKTNYQETWYMPIILEIKKIKKFHQSDALHLLEKITLLKYLVKLTGIKNDNLLITGDAHSNCRR